MFGENSDNSKVFTCKKCGSKPKGLNFWEFCYVQILCATLCQNEIAQIFNLKLSSRIKDTIRSKITNYILYDFRAQLVISYKFYMLWQGCILCLEIYF